MLIPWSFDLVHKVSKMTKKFKINACLGLCYMLDLFSKRQIQTRISEIINEKVPNLQKK